MTDDYVPNGLGPAWFPKWLTQRLTRLGRMFFDEANWGHHDHGYARGYPARAECDRLFLMAMLRDASLQPSALRAWGCSKAAWFLWACVRAFGWASYAKSTSETKGERPLRPPPATAMQTICDGDLRVRRSIRPAP